MLRNVFILVFQVGNVCMISFKVNWNLRGRGKATSQTYPPPPFSKSTNSVKTHFVSRTKTMIEAKLQNENINHIINFKFIEKLQMCFV